MDGQTDITTPDSVPCDHASLPENILGTASGTKFRYISLRTNKSIMVTGNCRDTHSSSLAPQCNCDLFVERVSTETEEFRTSEGTHCRVLRNHSSNVLC